ncbi:CDP-diacylglycerol--serine O-phosphatidyltransferase [bacterium]|nr:CDP-diacylglycerol--serine O-phosphatidyltransferase [bacterium]
MKILSLNGLKELGKKKLFMIPYFFTFANAFLGFMAVIKTLEGNYAVAAYCIIVAVLIMDTLDGRLARALHSSSSLGMELDSLCDAISFCLAPVILLYSWYLHAFGFVGFFVLTFFLCAGLLRLARFNVLTTQKGVSSFFLGMPTPVGALFIALLVVHYEWILATPFAFLLHPIGILVVVATLAYLMISSVRFPSFKLFQYSFLTSLLLFGGLGFIIIYSVVKGIPFFFLGITFYIFSSIFFQVYSFFRKIITKVH